MFRLHQLHRSGDNGPTAVRRVSRSRWAAVGAAVAVSIGAGSIGVVGATIDEGERPVLVQITPCRILDTRTDIGGSDSAIGAGTGEILTVQAHGMNGDCDIPAEASGLSLNVTAVRPSQRTNLRIFPDANNVPLASNLNPEPGQPPTPNAVTTLLDPAGTFSIFNEAGSVDLVIDVNGYYEDHNHDDRYVQETDVLWAVVRQNGNLVRSSDGVVSSERLDGTATTGDYGIVFERDISDCAYQATAGSTTTNVGPSPAYAMVANLTGDADNGVIVFVKDQDGAGTETRSFHVLVTC